MPSHFQAPSTAAYYAANWAVTTWFIDGTTGNDANAGNVIGSPLRTGAELLRRLGPYAIWAASVTVTVLSNGMTDGLVIAGYMPSGSQLDIVGVPTQLADAGTVATLLAVDHTIPRSTQVTTTLIADWTAYRWRRLRITTGASVDACAWIALANPAGAGLNVASISPFARINPASATAIIASASPAVGSAIVVEQLPRVPYISVALDGPVSVAAGNRWPLRQWSIQHIDCPTIVRKVSSEVRRFKGSCFGCRVQDIVVPLAVVPVSSFGSTDCFLWAREDPSDSAQARLVGALNFGLVGDGVAFANVSSPSSIVANVLFQGASLNISNTISVTFSQFFDIPNGNNYCIQVGELATVGLASVSGNRNLCATGIRFFNGCKVVRTNTTYNLTAATSDVQLATAPTVNLTTAQGFQPDDYSQKGTAQLALGTVTVTVPWYDNVIQQVVACHATPAAGASELTVNQISNTQFTIQSVNPADNDLVRWVMSPLGRNVVVV